MHFKRSFMILAAGLAGAAAIVAHAAPGSAGPELPVAYPKEWDVTFTQRAPLKTGDGFCQPAASGASGLCYGKYHGFDPKKITYAKGTRLFASTLPLACDIEMDQDVAITLRDGVKIYADVFRPAGQGRLPTIMAWGPYTKSVPQDPAWVYPRGCWIRPGFPAWRRSRRRIPATGPATAIPWSTSIRAGSTCRKGTCSPSAR